jgi:hypothetical protein
MGQDTLVHVPETKNILRFGNATNRAIIGNWSQLSIGDDNLWEIINNKECFSQQAALNELKVPVLPPMFSKGIITFGYVVQSIMKTWPYVIASCTEPLLSHPAHTFSSSIFVASKVITMLYCMKAETNDSLSLNSFFNVVAVGRSSNLFNA